VEEMDRDTARAAVLGGLVLGAGGGGLEEGMEVADATLRLGRPLLASLDEIDDDATVALVTSIGAPGAPRDTVRPWQDLRALHLLRAQARSSSPGACTREIVGVMTSHPGAWIAGTWIHAALDPTLVVVDCAANGRGHPTAAMGGMGLASRPEAQLWQTAVGGEAGKGNALELTIRGAMATTSAVVRRAAEVTGGRIASARGPLQVRFCRERGAVGAVSLSIRLGRAMQLAREGTPEELTEAIVDALGATVLVRGAVTAQDVHLLGSYDLGTVVVTGDEGSVELSVCNEYMTADLAGSRVATFPDLIVTLSCRDGMPTGASTMAVGDPVVVVAADRTLIPLGSGVTDPAVYPEVEEMLGRDISTFALRQGER